MDALCARSSRVPSSLEAEVWEVEEVEAEAVEEHEVVEEELEVVEEELEVECGAEAEAVELEDGEDEEFWEE